MAKICYAVAGEGRGHATRVRAMVEALRPHHQVVIFAADDAHGLLSQAYAGTEVVVRRIPCLRHGYDAAGRLRLGLTAWRALPFLLNVPGYLRSLLGEVERLSPDLVITDFEPLLPWVAQRLGIPFMSLDHQRFLTECDLSLLPGHLRRSARLLSLVVRCFYSGQKITVISSFFALPLKPSAKRVLQVGVLLRPELEHLQVQRGEHLVAYFRRPPSPELLEKLAQSGRSIRIYGAGVRQRQGGLQFLPLSEVGFAHDLASCAGLVATAGNQVVGEAVAFGKPVLALPEAGNMEQAINAFFVEACGVGRAIPYQHLEPWHVRELERFCAPQAPPKVALLGNGAPAALAAVEWALAGTTKLRPTPSGLRRPLPRPSPAGARP
ncbi:MAG: glycosyltransferase family protein [Thermoanaerobaculum sp.]|nr:glycosyltransferase family protein [Thermoanaerobaculum sp.]